jgi:hypothetical protein
MFELNQVLVNSCCYSKFACLEADLDAENNDGQIAADLTHDPDLKNLLLGTAFLCNIVMLCLCLNVNVFQERERHFRIRWSCIS